jgi:hypothetical protein
MLLRRLPVNKRLILANFLESENIHADFLLQKWLALLIPTFFPGQLYSNNHGNGKVLKSVP